MQRRMLESLFDASASSFAGFGFVPGSSLVVLSSQSPGLPYRLHCIDASTGGARPLDIEGVAPLPAPDGTRILFTTLRASTATVAVCGLEGGDLRELFNPGPGFLGQLCWSSDSRRIACVFAAPRSGAALRDRAEEPRAAVHVYSARESTVEQEIRSFDLTSGSWSTVYRAAQRIRDLSWVPGRRALVFSVSTSPDDARPWGEIRVLDLDSMQVRTLVVRAGVQHLRPRPSPDGRQVAFNLDSHNLPYPWSCDVALIGVDGGDVLRFTSDHFVHSSPAWHPASDRIFFLFTRGVYPQVAQVDLAGRVEVLTDSACWKLSELAVSAGGAHVAFASFDTSGEHRLRAISASGESTLHGGSPRRTASAAQAREIRWSARGGPAVAGLLLTPRAVDHRSRPLLVQLHGGPIGGVMGLSSLIQTPREWQMWVELGYVVLVPDYRSSGVYGWDHIEAARRNQDKHERDYDDIAAGIEEACRHTSVDRSRIVLMGHSYGATLVNWIVTQTHAFRAAVSFDGHVDFTYAWGTHRIAGTGSLTFEYLLDGTPWEAEVNYRRYSALPHLAKARTPCLLITAGRGVLSEYELMFTTLKRRGIDVELLHYPDEDHTLRRRANQQDLVERTVDWLEARLHPPS